ncbi:MAG: DNA methyltransferase [Thermoplasmata archaeon]
MRSDELNMLSSGARDTGAGETLPSPIDLSKEFGKYIGKQVSYATHGIHKYPAKFIPQIPRFCLESYSKVGDDVLDPFMGSGTTLLEAFISGRNSYGIDIHPLARLIAKVKTTPIDPAQLSSTAEKVLSRIREDHEDNTDWIPEIPNREHWFRRRVLVELATIKKSIWQLRPGDEKDFFKICFSSIIRKVSNSDDDSLIPEVTSFQRRLDEQGKTSYDAISRFENTVRNKLIDAADLWSLSKDVSKKYRRVPEVNIIGNDARDIDLEDSSIDLAITSPPYASAVHYVGVHKLEMYWLDMIKSTAELDARLVGTSRAYAADYKSWQPMVRIPALRAVIQELLAKDKKSAYVVYKYFEEMRKNLCEANRVLKRNGHYCVVAGENTFRRVRIPTYRILARIAEASGFETREVFVYNVINRHLDVPRWNESTIERDYILVFQRKGRAKDQPL